MESVTFDNDTKSSPDYTTAKSEGTLEVTEVTQVTELGGINQIEDEDADSGLFASLAKTCRKVLICILKSGPLPRHVGIVMDGNRRFARREHIETRLGHSAGFDAMRRLLEFSYALGIPEVTAYAFSIENFNRSEEEVAYLMDLARKRLKMLSDNGGLADKYGVRIRFLGNLELLEKDIQQVAEEVTERTKNNNRATLNLCMPYTARDDITQAIDRIANTGSTSITEKDISDNMYTKHCAPLDLLIRTSDTHRFSDFLLWETQPETKIEFVKKLWPEYTSWDYFKTLLWWSYEKFSH